MASAQVLSNSAVSSRKQELLEAGKRRLEEFRKKKAAAKKTASSSQPRTVVSIANEKQASGSGQEQSLNAVGAVADRRTDAVAETSDLFDHVDKSRGHAHDNGSKLVLPVEADDLSYGSMTSEMTQMQAKQEGNKKHISGLEYQKGFVDSQPMENGVAKFGADYGEGRFNHGVPFGVSTAAHDGDAGYLRSTFYGESLSNRNSSSSDSLPYATNSVNDGAVYSGNPASYLFNESDPGYGQHAPLEPKILAAATVDEEKPGKTPMNLSNFYDKEASEPISVGLNSGVSGFVNGPLYSSVSETHSRRSRPSFLDSLNIGRDSPASGRLYSEKEISTTSKDSRINFAAPSIMQEPSVSSIPVEPLPTPASVDPNTDFFGKAFREQKSFEQSLETKLESHLQKQNEDFAALEQHIEDLTQEKFSLQRALEASKALAESLAAENSSLTESYNQQGSIIGQLKDEMERLQREIKTRLVELESIKAEYMNAQLECNAADERAKLLASEVIGLEEKALRLRSNELKLERELENSSAEIASNKKKLASLDKERQDLLQTIDALQEEKKLLQSKLRRASASGISIDMSKGHGKTDASTSTSDLDVDATGVYGDPSEQASSNMQVHDDSENLLSLIHNTPAGFDISTLNIPVDQVQTIQKINSLFSEIMSEKEELVHALVAEVSTSAKLKDLNKELSHKLEIQTQRLELLTAQSMASENITGREPTAPCIVRESVAYADEGDEVVERVLGWIMKLFPGGPSKRRSSRL